MLDQLKTLGVSFETRKGQLRASGLSALPPETANTARSWIRANKKWIIRTLAQRAPHPARVTPAMVASWRIARKWIFANLTALETAGWTRATLFKAGRIGLPSWTMGRGLAGRVGLAWTDRGLGSGWSDCFYLGGVRERICYSEGQAVALCDRPESQTGAARRPQYVQRSSSRKEVGK